ncbi:MAG: membrane dipeptidase [Proteobacteria bacterium]|nr:membrane dipeptidase [Pseudomonadota bacterium]
MSAMPSRLVPQWREGRPWLAETIVCDGLLPWAKHLLPDGADLGQQLRRFWHSGVDHISLTAAAGNEGPLEALTRVGFLRRELAAHRDWVRVVDSVHEIETARRDGVLSVSLHFQTATPFVPSLDLVEAFKAAGVGRAILAYNEGNAFADGCHEQRDGGLTAYGRRLIERMDEVGMIVDLSHCGVRTSFEALEAPLRRAPIFSHSNARALFDHERNISDDQIRTCAARGGYIGINGAGMFLGADGPGIPQAIAEHAAHVATVAGAERVGLGLDFMYLEGSDYGFFHTARGRWPRGYPQPPWDFFQPEQFGELVAALERQGFTGEALAGVLGENYLRFAN